MPVLVLARVPLLLITQMASDIQVGMAWIFVALRIVHSIIHVRKGSVPWRFRVYLLSCVVLLSLWIGFAIDFATIWARPCSRHGRGICARSKGASAEERRVGTECVSRCRSSGLPEN